MPWTPAHAASCKQIDGQSRKFAPRRDVRFNDGARFAASDVIASDVIASDVIASNVIASLLHIPALPYNPGPHASGRRTITGTAAIDRHTGR